MSVVLSSKRLQWTRHKNRRRLSQAVWTVHATGCVCRGSTGIWNRSLETAVQTAAIEVRPEYVTESLPAREFCF